jgi:hypothetical protein
MNLNYIASILNILKFRTYKFLAIIQIDNNKKDRECNFLF